MSEISFKASLLKVGSWIIVRLPKSASAKLPSRGQVMVEGMIDGHEIRTPLEPDGAMSHWFIVDGSLLKSLRKNVGDDVALTLQAATDWLEPKPSAEFKKAMSGSPAATELWKDITPMARWEWVRWIRSTGNEDTRKHRIEVALSKMNAGKRRPCCWNRNLCSEPSVSKNGVLIAPEN